MRKRKSARPPQQSKDRSASRGARTSDDSAVAAGTEEAEMRVVWRQWRAGKVEPPGLPVGFSIDPDLLPARATMQRRVASFIRLHAALQLAVDDGRPLMITGSWLVANVDGLYDTRHARRELLSLERAGLIRGVGATERRARLWEPAGTTMAETLELIYREDVPLRPAVFGTAPEVPAVGGEVAVHPGAEVEQQSVVDQAEPIDWDDLRVVAARDGAVSRYDRTAANAGREIHASGLSSE